MKQFWIRLGTKPAHIGPCLALIVLLFGLASTITPGFAVGQPTATSIPMADTGALIKVGQTVRGIVLGKPGDPRYAIFGPAGSMISIGVFPDVNSPIVPTFDLYAPDGSRVLSVTAPLTDPTGAFGRGAIASGFTLPVTGAYILYIKAAKNQYGGPFVLSVGDGWTLRDIDNGKIAPEITYRGKIFRIGDRALWSVDLPANATITVQAAPDQSKLDPVLEVVSPDGKVLGTGHDASAAHTAQISNLITPVQGRYQIRIAGLANLTVGGYSLLMKILQITPTATFIAELDSTQSVQLKQDEQFSYNFNGVPNEVLRVEVIVNPQDQFAPVIEVYGPGGRRLAHNEDSPGNLEDSNDLVLQIALDDGIGVYRVEVYGYARMPGSFTLKIITNVSK